MKCGNPDCENLHGPLFITVLFGGFKQARIDILHKM